MWRRRSVGTCACPCIASRAQRGIKNVVATAGPWTAVASDSATPPSGWAARGQTHHLDSVPPEHSEGGVALSLPAAIQGTFLAQRGYSLAETALDFPRRTERCREPARTDESSAPHFAHRRPATAPSSFAQPTADGRTNARHRGAPAVKVSADESPRPPARRTARRSRGGSVFFPVTVHADGCDGRRC